MPAKGPQHAQALKRKKNKKKRLYSQKRKAGWQKKKQRSNKKRANSGPKRGTHILGLHSVAFGWGIQSILVLRNTIKASTMHALRALIEGSILYCMVRITHWYSRVYSCAWCNINLEFHTKITSKIAHVTMSQGCRDDLVNRWMPHYYYYYFVIVCTQKNAVKKFKDNHKRDDITYTVYTYRMPICFSLKTHRCMFCFNISISEKKHIQM